MITRYLYKLFEFSNIQGPINEQYDNFLVLGNPIDALCGRRGNALIASYRIDSDLEVFTSLPILRYHANG